MAKRKLEQYTSAKEDFDMGIKYNPNKASYYYQRGFSNYDLGNYEDAIADYDRAIAKDTPVASISTSVV